MLTKDDLDAIEVLYDKIHSKWWFEVPDYLKANMVDKIPVLLQHIAGLEAALANFKGSVVSFEKAKLGDVLGYTQMVYGGRGKMLPYEFDDKDDENEQAGAGGDGE